MLSTHHDDATSDEMLAERARAGSANAFVILVARYRDRIYRVAIRMSRNASDAEEVVQDTFLRAHSAIGAFRGESRFATWLYRIAVNSVRMRQRTARRRPAELLAGVSAHALESTTALTQAHQGPEALVDSKTVTRRVREALDQLDEDQRAAIVLRDLEELTAAEAAQILGVSMDVVRQRAHRGRLTLRTLLADLVTEPRPA
jgi:RNA polymerase sigma-70 factor (ECF subfamily)